MNRLLSALSNPPAYYLVENLDTGEWTTVDKPGATAADIPKTWGACRVRVTGKTGEKPSAALYWQSSGYTTVRTATGQFSFRGTTPEALAAHRADSIAAIARHTKLIAALDAVETGTARLHPSALNF